MPNFTAGTTFGANDTVTNTKLNNLIADATINPECSFGINSGTIGTLGCTRGTVATLNSTTGTIATLNSTTGTIPSLTTGTTTSTNQVVTNGTITNLSATTSTFLGAITGSTNIVNIGSGQIYKDSSGNLGIGITPYQKLDVNGGSVIRGTLFLGDGSSSVIRKLTSSTPLTFANQGGSAEITIDSSGNVGIGMTSPDAKLAIDAPGSSTPTAPISCNATSGAGDRYAALFRYSGTLSGSVTVNGAAAAYNTSSDYRLKTNLEPISNGIERIKQLPVYRFNWKMNEGGNKVDGFVAHEVTPIVREAIHGEKDAVDADGNPIYQGIDQSKIVPLLTAALKEAIAKIETLEAKVAALEAA